MTPNEIYNEIIKIEYDDLRDVFLLCDDMLLSNMMLTMNIIIHDRLLARDNEGIYDN